MKKVAITGGKGTIGTVLRNGLQDVEITVLDLPEHDVRNPAVLDKGFAGQDAVIHLALDDKLPENARNQNLDPDNSLMSYNVMSRAHAAGVKRVISASSVHADHFYTPKDGLYSVDTIPTPNNPYGANKVLMEALGRYYSTLGLEVVAVRFGGVNPEDAIPYDNPIKTEVNTWLSHRDCVTLIQAALDAPTVPDNFCAVYAVSDNDGRRHDITNPFGWTPQDGYRR